MEQDAEKAFSKELRRSIEAREAGNIGQADDFLDNAFANLRIAGYPEDKIHEAIAKATQGQNLVNSMKWEYYTRGVNEYRKPYAKDAYERLIKQQ